MCCIEAVNGTRMISVLSPNERNHVNQETDVESVTGYVLVTAFRYVMAYPEVMERRHCERDSGSTCAWFLTPSCRQLLRTSHPFIETGKIAAARVKTTSTAGRKPNDSDNSSKVHRSSASTMRVSESISARYPVPPDETTSTSECEKSRALYPPYQRKRSSRKGRRRLSDTLESPYEASTTTAVATSDSTSPCRCQGCRAASRGAIVVPSAPISSVPRVRMMRGGSDLDNRTNHSETCEYRRQSTRRETKCLPKLGGR